MNAAVHWVEVRVLAPEGWLELVAQTLAAHAPGGAAFGRSSLAADPLPEGGGCVRVFLADRDDSPARRAAIAHDLLGLAEATGASELAGLRAEFRPLPPEDYAISWKKTWKPFRVGRLCVVPPGDERRLRPGDVRLFLEPGGAFGSGRHGTTRECLRVAQERTARGDRILDAGSGSGILAVGAILLGAGRAVGFDVDPDAKPYADVLARENGAADRCHFLAAGFECLDGMREPFDGIVANIYADVIAAGIEAFARALRPGGWFAFSGCTEARSGGLVETISESPLRIERERVSGRWRTYSGTRIRA